MRHEKKLVFLTVPLCVLLIVGGIYLETYSGVLIGAIGLIASCIAWNEFTEVKK